MLRRTCLAGLGSAGAALALPSQTLQSGKPVQLHMDLEVEPVRENELLANYRTTFRPAVSGQPGFVGVALLKFQRTVSGAAPSPAPYRLEIIFASEELRQKWVASPAHQKAWTTIEQTLRDKYPKALLYQEL